MSLAPFVAETMLQAAHNGTCPESLMTLYKELRDKDDSPHPDIIKLVTSWIGKRCRVKLTRYSGLVDSVNLSSGGIYNGARFPVRVKILNSRYPEVIGRVFEYGLEQIELIEE